MRITWWSCRSRVLLVAVVTVAGISAGTTAGAASATVTPPPGCVIATDFGGLGRYDLQDNGPGRQATMERVNQCLQFVNETDVGGVSYWQLEDNTFQGVDVCLSDAAAPEAQFRACTSNPVAADQLVRLIGSGSNNLVEFDQGSQYLSSASLSQGALVGVSASSAPTSENEWMFSGEFPALQVLPADFATGGPTSGDWNTIAQSPPPFGTRNVIYEVCQTVSGVFECGGANTQADTAWYAPLKQLCDAGVRPLYYIGTQDGGVPLATVEKDISNALSWYPATKIDCEEGTGIMLDGVSATDPSDGHGGFYYQDLVNYYNSQLAGVDDTIHIFLNAGAPTTANYTTYASDVIVQEFENSSDNWENNYSAPAWLGTCGCGSQVSAMVTRPAGDPDFQTDLSLAASRGYGYIYVESLGEPDPPYNSLPSYYDQETWEAAQQS
jgi:hypothetical protein